MRIKFWIPAILWMAAIFLFSTDWFSGNQTFSIFRTLVNWLFPALSPEIVEGLHLFVRKAAHFIAYAILSLFYAMGFSQSITFTPKVPRGQAALSILFSVLYAITDEWHQSFSPLRTPSALDVGVDALGAMFIQLVIRLR
jgi:VanZ family protein